MRIDEKPEAYGKYMERAAGKFISADNVLAYITTLTNARVKQE